MEATGVELIPKQPGCSDRASSGLAFHPPAMNLGPKGEQPLRYTVFATTSYPIEDVKRHWDPGRLANI